MVDRNACNHLTVWKKISGSCKNIMNELCLQIIYLIYIYKEDLALNDLRWLIPIKPNQPNHLLGYFFFSMFSLCSFHFDIVEDPETPCEWITRSIKDASKREPSAWSEGTLSGIQDTIEYLYIICYVVLSNDKLVILTLRVESLFILIIFPQGYITLKVCHAIHDSVFSTEVLILSFGLEWILISLFGMCWLFLSELS